MAEVKANARLVSTVKLARVLRANAAKRAMMRAALHALVESLAGRIEAISTDIAEIESMGEGGEDATFAKTHALLGRMLKGIRYVWSDHPVVLKTLEPLQVGENENEDFNRLSFLFSKVTSPLKPKFVWVEDFTAEMVRDQLKAHIPAHAKALASAEVRLKEAQLRALRPEAEKLWREHKVEQWVEVNADNHEDAIAMGLERRHRPRKPKAEGEEGAKKKKTTTKEKAETPASEEKKELETELEE